MCILALSNFWQIDLALVGRISAAFSAHDSYAVFVQVSRYAALFVSLQLLTISLGQFFVKKKKRTRQNLYLALFTASAAGIFFPMWNVDQNHYYIFPQLSLLDIPLLYACAPAIYLALRTAQGKDGKSFWRHFILPVAAGLATLPYYLVDAAKKKWLYQLGTDYLFFFIIYLGGVLVAGIYMAVASRFFMILFSVENLRRDPNVRMFSYILFFSLIVAANGVLAALYLDFIFFRINAIVAALGLMGHTILMHRYPEFLGDVIVIMNQPARKEPLRSDQIQHVSQKVREAVVIRNLIDNPDFSLAMLSRETGLSLHILSQYLNEYHGGFYYFLHEVRIANAKRLLATSEMSVLDIAFAVGFNSKSAFNRVFKDKVGMTPVDYRRQENPGQTAISK